MASTSVHPLAISERPVEAERLYAVLDGLTVHAVTRPDRLSPGRATAVLARHLDSLR